MRLVETIEAMKKIGLAVTLSVEDQPALQLSVNKKSVKINIKNPELVGRLIKKTGLA